MNFFYVILISLNRHFFSKNIEEKSHLPNLNFYIFHTIQDATQLLWFNILHIYVLLSDVDIYIQDSYLYNYPLLYKEHNKICTKYNRKRNKLSSSTYNKLHMYIYESFLSYLHNHTIYIYFQMVIFKFLCFVQNHLVSYFPRLWVLSETI